MNVYREKIVFSGRVIRCSIYVMSVGTAGRDLGQSDVTNVIASVKRTADLSGMIPATKFTWRGSSYTLQNMPVPIVAMGGIDHYELHAKRVIG